MSKHTYLEEDVKKKLFIEDATETVFMYSSKRIIMIRWGRRRRRRRRRRRMRRSFSLDTKVFFLVTEEGVCVKRSSSVYIKVFFRVHKGLLPCHGRRPLC